MAMRDALLDGSAPRREPDAHVTFYLHAQSLGDPKVKKLKQLLASWLNMYLREDKIYVRDLAEDLHDGQLLLSFLEKVTAENIRYNVGATAEKNKRTNLNLLVKFVRDRFGIVCEEGIVDGILEKDFVSVTRLLVMLSHELQCPFQLPSNVEVVIAHRVNHKDGSVSNKTSRHMVTGDESAYGKSEKELGTMLSGVSISDKEEKVDEDPNMRDAFDELLEPGAEAKLDAVKMLLLAFVNRHLSPLGVTVSNVGNQFHDGVYLIMLIGSLGGFFVPPYNYHMAPTTTDMKVHNVNTAFKLMRSLEIQRNKWNAEAVVRQDVGVIIRILYALYSAFKNASV